MRLATCALLFTLCVCLASNVHAQGIDAWKAAALKAGAGYTNTNVTVPSTDDIGTYDIGTNGGVAYEFIYNADVGGPSSAFMGSLSAPAGDSAGFKLDQWNMTGKFGATAFGVADYTFATDHILKADTHVVYVMDGADTAFYVNGALAENFAGASFALSGLTGLGHAYNHANEGSVDAMNGTLLGVAVYDSAISAATVKGNFDAFVPEPGALTLLGLGLFGLAKLRRRRDS